MIESKDIEKFWAVKNAEVIIQTHARFQRLRYKFKGFPAEHPVWTGILIGSAATILALYIKDSLQAKAQK